MISWTKCLIVLTALIATAEATSYWHNASDGRRFFIDNDDEYNWFQAVHQCERLNMQLIEIQTSQKNELLMTILHSLFANAPNFWLGANDEYNESKDMKRPFYWSTSGKRMTFSNWSKGNPNNRKKNQHCVITSDSQYKWDDVECTLKYGYICEDNYVSVEKCQELKSISSNITTNNEQCLKQQMQNLDNGMKSLQQTEMKFAEQLLKVQVAFVADIEQLVAISRKITLADEDERNKTIQRQIADIKTAIDKVKKTFSNKIKSSQRNFENIFNF